MGQKSRGRDRVGCSKRQADAPIHTVMSSIVVAGSRHAVEMDVRRRVTSAARTRREIISIAAAVQRHAVGMGAKLPAMFAAQTQTTTNSHATAHAAGMRVLRQAASAVNLGGSKNGILSATTQNAGAPSTGAPTTRQPSVC